MACKTSASACKDQHEEGQGMHRTGGESLRQGCEEGLVLTDCRQVPVSSKLLRVGSFDKCGFEQYALKSPTEPMSSASTFGVSQHLQGTPAKGKVKITSMEKRWQESATTTAIGDSIRHDASTTGSRNILYYDLPVPIVMVAGNKAVLATQVQITRAKRMTCHSRTCKKKITVLTLPGYVSVPSRTNDAKSNDIGIYASQESE